ncbi:menaquinone-specific isochorismate synthase [Ereboglobus sp. PH5-10]|uniref:isochorismate synthase n=1 Tax=Ereboglobus sp. PH5-10 TaxID=2940629 RepID=UPI002404D7C2|nr:isochorismate synthase [Ereboglobus sp. PH5-10]MDF9827212.1 menaquinone-specific isochorismate synthase [Ereboglobus sp. PH5-10]
MTILPIDPDANANPAALLDFLEQCRAMAAEVNRPRLVSITLEVSALDPLAVLESIFEPNERHFYVERPAENFALAGAEAVLEFSARGAQRFADCQRFIDSTLADAIAVGDQTATFAGPHFFTAYSFFDSTEPGEPFESAGVFIPRWQVALANGRTTAVANFIVTPDSDITALTKKVWHAHQKVARAASPGMGKTTLPRGLATRATATPGYRAAVSRALALIEAGEFHKIVLARAIDFTTPDNAPLHPLRILNGLRQRFADCYSFSLANGHGQSFIGASPERLLRVRDRRLLTEALAGSAPRGASASEDASLGATLLHNEKDVREQRHVLDSIRRRLEPLGLKLTHPAQPGLRKLANVQHLHTPVEAPLPDGVRLLDALARLHPTPAVGGTPREAAVARIRELEGFPRGLYAGAIGWIDAHGNGEFFVGLRSALIDGPNARLYAGAGIVAGSSPEKEFEETEIKFRAIRDALLG